MTSKRSTEITTIHLNHNLLICANFPLAGEKGEHAKSEVQVAAQAGPSSRLSQEAHSRSR
jgi:hypothetical protein